MSFEDHIAQIKRKPEVWCRLKNVEILAPDGWRGAYLKPYDEPITEADFDARALLCTLRIVPMSRRTA